MGSGLVYVNPTMWGDYLGYRTLTVDSASMDISSIPSGYKYLVIEITAQLEAGKPATTCVIRFNNDAGNNYSFLKMYGIAGGVVDTVSIVTTWLYGPNINNARPATTQITVSQIPSASFKAFWLTGGDENQAFVTSGCYFSATEINQVTVFAASGDLLLAGSQVHIYGVK